jgi:protein arginine N-methyltransferase 1
MIESQRRLLGDRVRNDAFAAALAKAIQPNRTRVADLGTGTGFLALLAERAGARSVWACDLHQGVIDLARKVLKANGSQRVRLLAGHSTALAPPEPVDLVVSETLGHFAGEEHLIESLVDARRWLAPGGRMIPAAVDQILCPVIGDTVQRGIDVLGGHHGIDLAAVRHVALSNGYVRTLDPAQLLDGGRAGQVVDRMRFPNDEPSRRQGKATWELPGGTIHGLGLWWDAELIADIHLSTSPLAPPTHWEQIYLPLVNPLACKRGDRLECQIAWDTRLDQGCVVRWQGRLLRQGKAVASFNHDNRTGFL